MFNMVLKSKGLNELYSVLTEENDKLNKYIIGLQIDGGDLKMEKIAHSYIKYHKEMMKLILKVDKK